MLVLGQELVEVAFVDFQLAVSDGVLAFIATAGMATSGKGLATGTFNLVRMASLAADAVSSLDSMSTRTRDVRHGFLLVESEWISENGHFKSIFGFLFIYLVLV